MTSTSLFRSLVKAESDLNQMGRSAFKDVPTSDDSYLRYQIARNDRQTQYSFEPRLTQSQKLDVSKVKSMKQFGTLAQGERPTNANVPNAIPPENVRLESVFRHAKLAPFEVNIRDGVGYDDLSAPRETVLFDKPDPADNELHFHHMINDKKVAKHISQGDWFENRIAPPVVINIREPGKQVFPFPRDTRLTL